MAKSRIANFDVSFTMDSSQTPTFTWQKINSTEYVELSTGRKSSVTIGEIEQREKYRKMFKLDDDVSTIYAKISTDDVILRKATTKYGCLRLTHCDE